MQKSPETEVTQSFKIFICCAVIFLSAFALYHPSLKYGLTLLDDVNMIRTAAEKYNSPSFLAGAFKNDVLFGASPTPYYRPVLALSFALSHQIAPQSERFAHFVNVVLHCFCALLVFFFLKKYLFGAGAAFFAALVFALHPAAIQTAAWIPGRNDSLLLIFFIVCAASFIEYAKSAKTRFLSIHVLFFLLCLFTKESALALPLIPLAYYALNKNSLKTNTARIIAHCVIWAACAALFLFARKAVFPAGAFSPIDLQSGGIFAFFNHISAILFLRTPLAAYNSVKICILGSISVIILLAAVFYDGKDKRVFKLKFLCLFSIFIFLLPDFMTPPLFFHGNRMYAPLLGTIIIVFYFAASFCKNKRIRPKYVLPVYAAFILLCAAATAKNLPQTKDGVTFWGGIVKESSAVDSTAHKFLIYSYLEAGRHRKALGTARHSAMLTKYGQNDIIELLANLYALEEDYENAAKYFELLLRQSDTVNAGIYLNLYDAYARLKNDGQAGEIYKTLLKTTGLPEPELDAQIELFRQARQRHRLEIFNKKSRQELI
jgi:hypothetical protein